MYNMMVLTLNSYLHWFNQEKPIILFLTSYDYYPAMNFNVTDTQTTMLGYTKTVGHAVVACAYVEYTYYLSGSAFQTDKWLYVVFGGNKQHGSGFLSR